VLPLMQTALRRLIAEGHELGSHAAEHVHLSQLPAAEVQKQIEWAVSNISSVTGDKAVPVSCPCSMQRHCKKFAVLAKLNALASFLCQHLHDCLSINACSSGSIVL
jgi:hypothetical protein